MGIGAGIFLIAAGAVMRFAVSVNGHGFNIHTIGIILMIVGALGILLDLLLFMPRRRTVDTRDDVYVRRDTIV